MADQTYTHTGFAGLTMASSLRASAAVCAWIGVRVRVQGNPKSLVERWKA